MDCDLCNTQHCGAFACEHCHTISLSEIFHTLSLRFLNQLQCDQRLVLSIRGVRNQVSAVVRDARVLSVYLRVRDGTFCVHAAAVSVRARVCVYVFGEKGVVCGTLLMHAQVALLFCFIFC